MGGINYVLYIRTCINDNRFLIVIICGIIINRKDIIKDEKGT